MPEGPEIHRQADRIRRVLKEEECAYAYFYHDHLKEFESRLTGCTIQSVRAKGKAIITGFEGGLFMYSHNQLYGKWMIRNAGTYPKTNRQLRAEIQTAKKSALLYSASEIEILDSESLDEHSYLSKLGPDILENLSVEEIAERAQSDTFRRRSFAALLLDQSFLGGVGNYLRSEILFHASIHPKDRPMDLSKEELNEFGKSVLIISHRAYEEKGITLNPGKVEELKAAGKRRKAYRHYAYGRGGKSCYRCGSEIEKLKMSGRNIFICPKCQISIRNQ